MSHEFDLIEQYFKPLAQVDEGELGIGDDGAILNCPSESQLVVVTDTSVAGRHFPLDTEPFDIGWKVLAVNLSDLAAMGAQPAFYSLALTLPPVHNNPHWLRQFSAGLKALSEKSRIRLIGGDTTQGNLSITVTAQGWVARNRALLRAGARVGQDIYVSGLIGEGGLGLVNIQAGLFSEDVGYSVSAIEKLNRPEPRLTLGYELLNKGLSNCAIDISDGFLADLTHILKASHLSADIFFEAIPRSEEAKAWALKTDNRLFGLNTGDDYELCFTADSAHAEAIQALAHDLGVSLTKVGETRPFSGDYLRLLDEGGEKITLSKLGYQHF